MSNYRKSVTFMLTNRLTALELGREAERTGKPESVIIRELLNDRYMIAGEPCEHWNHDRSCIERVVRANYTQGFANKALCEEIARQLNFLKLVTNDGWKWTAKNVAFYIENRFPLHWNTPAQNAADDDYYEKHAF